MGNEIQKLNAGISFIAEQINKDMALSQIRIFLETCMQEGIDMYYLADKLELHQASVSRNVKELSTYVVRDKDGTKKTLGYGLIHTEQGIENRRRLELTLTKKGRDLKKHLESFLRAAERAM